jgi:hypothetical protein
MIRRAFLATVLLLCVGCQNAKWRSQTATASSSAFQLREVVGANHPGAVAFAFKPVAYAETTKGFMSSEAFMDSSALDEVSVTTIEVAAAPFSAIVLQFGSYGQSLWNYYDVQFRGNEIAVVIDGKVRATMEVEWFNYIVNSDRPRVCITLPYGEDSKEAIDGILTAIRNDMKLHKRTTLRTPSHQRPYYYEHLLLATMKNPYSALRIHFFETYPTETVAVKIRHFQKVIATLNKEGLTVPIFLSPEAAGRIVEGLTPDQQKDAKPITLGETEQAELSQLPLVRILESFCNAKDLKLRYTERGILIDVLKPHH